MDKIQPAIKKETKRIAVFTAAGVVIMWVVFAVLHQVSPETVPFDYRIFLSGVLGGGVAVLNFFLMGLTVQKAASSWETRSFCSISLVLLTTEKI